MRLEKLAHSITMSACGLRFRQWISCAIAFVGATGRALRSWWPWAIAAFVYSVFVHSGQGLALAKAAKNSAVSLMAIASTIVGTGILVFLGATLTLVATKGRVRALSTDDPASGLRISSAECLWGAFLTAVFGLLFSTTTHIWIAWLATGFLFASGGVALVWLAKVFRHPSSRVNQLLQASRRYRLMIVLAALVVSLAPLLIAARIVTVNPMGFSTVGPLLVTMLGLATLATFFSLLLIVIPATLGISWLGVLVVAGALAWSATRPLEVDEENPLLREERIAAEAKNTQATGCIEAPYALHEVINPGRVPKDTPLSSEPGNEPLYLVSAEGGGIRAAYWSASVLGNLDIALKGRFAKNVATLSGVSGGSLGVATWVAAQERVDLSPREKLDLMQKFLASDFLSPIVGGLLFLDMPRSVAGPLWPKARREHVFEKAISDQWKAIAGTDFFSRPMRELCLRGFDEPPAIFFNATEVSKGMYVPLGRTSLEGKTRVKTETERKFWQSTLRDATVAQLVHVSARFPYVAPAAAVGVNTAEIAWEEGYATVNSAEYPNEQERENAIDALDARIEKLRNEMLFKLIGVLVDGGYFDNTGLTPTREAIALADQNVRFALKERGGNNSNQRALSVIHISNDPAGVCIPVDPHWASRLDARAKRVAEETGFDPQCESEIETLVRSLSSRPLDWLTAPLESVFSVRGAHSMMAKKAVKASLRDSPLKSRFCDFSLAEEFSGAYESKSGNNKQVRLFVGPEHIKNELSFLDMYVQHANMLLEYSRQNPNALSADKVHRLSVYQGAADEWRAHVSRYPADPDCIGDKLFGELPLGWTLNDANRQLLDCLAWRSVVSQQFFPPPIPTLPNVFGHRQKINYR